MKRLLLTAIAIVALAFTGAPAMAAASHNKVAYPLSCAELDKLDPNAVVKASDILGCLHHMALLKSQHPTMVTINLGGTGGGPIGPMGPQGPKGDSIVGPAGPQGNPGADGKDGKDGADSTVPGPQGPAGPPGNDGADGQDGKDGKDGVCIGICITVPHH